MSNGKAKPITEAVVSVKLVKETVKQQFLQEIDKQCQKLCVQNRGTPSVLNVKETSSSDALMNSSWEKVMIEMRDCAPDVLDVITTICKLPSVTDVPAVYMTYSILMYQRNSKLGMLLSATGKCCADSNMYYAWHLHQNNISLFS